MGSMNKEFNRKAQMLRWSFPELLRLKPLSTLHLLKLSPPRKLHQSKPHWHLLSGNCRIRLAEGAPSQHSSSILTTERRAARCLRFLLQHVLCTEVPTTAADGIGSCQRFSHGVTAGVTARGIPRSCRMSSGSQHKRCVV